MNGSFAVRVFAGRKSRDWKLFQNLMQKDTREPVPEKGARNQPLSGLSGIALSNRGGTAGNTLVPDDIFVVSTGVF